MGTSQTTESGGVFSSVGDNFFKALGAVTGGVAAAILAPEIIAAGVATGIGVVAGGAAVSAYQAFRGPTQSTGTPTNDPPKTNLTPNNTNGEQPKLTNPEPVVTGQKQPEPTRQGQTEPPKQQGQAKVSDVKLCLEMARGNKRATPVGAADDEKKELDDERDHIIAIAEKAGVTQSEIDKAKEDLAKLESRVVEVTSNISKRGKTADTLLKRLEEAKNKPPTGADPGETAVMDQKRADIEKALRGTLSESILKQAGLDIDQLPAEAAKLSKAMSDRGQQLSGLVAGLNDPKYGAPTPAGATGAEKTTLSTKRKDVFTALKATNPNIKQLSDAQDAIQQLANHVVTLVQTINARPGRLSSLKDLLTNTNKPLPDALPTEADGLSKSFAPINDTLTKLSLTDDKVDEILNQAEADIKTFGQAVTKVEVDIAERAKAAKVRKTAAEAVWQDEMNRLIDLVPELFRVIPRPEWMPIVKAATDTEWNGLQARLDKAMANLIQPKELRAAANLEIAKDKTSREKAWIEKAWKVAGLKARDGAANAPVPTRDDIWRWLQWGSIRGTDWNLRILRTASGSRKELHITVSGDSIPEPSVLVHNDRDFLDKSPSHIFDTMFTHQSRALRVHVTKGDANGHRNGTNEHLYIGDVCAGGDFDGDGGAMQKGLADFKATSIGHIISAKLRGWT
jgi:ABC-type transporter Mla subunit MlaD